MRIAIAGAGSVGRSIAGELVENGHQVMLIDRDPEEIKPGRIEAAIQAGAMLAVIWEYRVRIASVLSGLFTERRAQRFVLNLVVAFLPASGLGFLFNSRIKEVLFAPVPVAMAFIVGGLVIGMYLPIFKLASVV